MLGTHFRPLGTQAVPAVRVSRRIFLGTGITVPFALSLDAQAQPVASNEPNDLRFVEDADGVTIIDVHGAMWRLRRRAFGPKIKFALRTLRDGPEKGHEIEIRGVRFGARQACSHWMLFLRSGNNWKIRMRSNLWSSSGHESTSSDVPFERLATPKPSAKTLKRDQPCEARKPLIFKSLATGLSDALAGVFEGHVRAYGGVELEFTADAVWRLAPRAGGRIVIAPFGFTLTHIMFAWCDSVTKTARECVTALAADLWPAGTLDGSAKAESEEPVFCASGPINPQKAALRCNGESSFAVDIEPVPTPEGQPTALSYTYLRRDWVTAGPGASEIRGPFRVTTHLGRRNTLVALREDGTETGLRVAEGTIRTWRKTDKQSTLVEVRFSGTASPEPARYTTPIGQIKASGWPIDASSATGEPRQIHIHARYPRLDVTSAPARVTSVDIPLLVSESELALDGAELSRLEFKSTAVLALWRPLAEINKALPLGDSYMWLGASHALKGRPVARLDLTRARVTASRSSDLLRVAFMFGDFFLEVRRGDLKIVPASTTCRVVKRDAPSPNNVAAPEPLVIDARPTLVVEFPPQHMFEESLFKSGFADLPEVRLPDKPAEFEVTVPDRGSLTFSTAPTILLRELEERVLDATQRTAVRRRYADLKKEREQGQDPKPFTTLSDAFVGAFNNKFGEKAAFADQAIYIGPYGMDPDVSALARAAMRAKQRAVIEKLFRNVLGHADGVAEELNNPDLPLAGAQTFIRRLARRARLIFRDRFGGSLADNDSPEGALLKENAICAVLGEYAFFRDFYREEMTRRLMEGARENDGAALQPADAQITQLEYFSENNRKWADNTLAEALDARKERCVRLYIDHLSGDVPPPNSVRARLSNSSRLAFHVTCEAAGFLPFTLDALTNWNRYELAVTPRARAVAVYDEAGRPVPDATGQATTQEKQAGAQEKKAEAPEKKIGAQGKGSLGSGASEDIAMLSSLGIRAGEFITAQERLSDVEASLRNAPGPLETAIEIPARLILSPSQRALWRTPHRQTADASKPSARQQKASGASLRSVGPILLWGAELVTDNPHPAVRAVYSPDLRPGFVRRGLERAASAWGNQKRTEDKKPRLYTPALSPPPRGPRAPWTVGIEEGDPSSSQLEAVVAAVGGKDDLSKPLSDGACEAAELRPNDASGAHPLVQYLRWRQAARSAYKTNGLFRSSLDAYDRHEIVLLSSAFGLPVRGKREPSGQLLPPQTSSQVEPPRLLRPIDLEAGTALYRPQPLEVQELRLTALGGTLRHDTDFVPPTAARHIVHGALFDSLSIERWQHWVVLGRDVFAEVVYKGFLFPIGHRASLVKQTERVFLRAPAEKGTTEKGTADRGSIRAFLRQRMFIRVGQPDKVFPALGHPNMGRQFPPRLVRILTTVTPDLVDPAQDTTEATDDNGRQIPTPGGRVFATQPGLVFWPRTARIAGTEVKFEALLDSAFVRIPLMFVDNTAAHDPEVLEKLVNDYRLVSGPDEGSGEELGPVHAHDHLRTIDCAGQALRYCEELKPGSATHRTLFWTLSVSGGVTTPPLRELIGAETRSGAAWEGENTRYDDPALEGADQPSFYPILETARIRLDQVERMTARQSVVGLARFDGYYIANGFPPPQGGAGSLSRRTDPFNPLEIYLDIINAVPFDMGAGGDRSGGLFRPASTVVGLSRLRGPVGGDPLIGRGPALTTVVGTYTSARETTPPADRTPPESDKTAYHGFFKNVGKASDAFKTKILGVVDISTLIDHLVDLKPASEGLPRLQEVLNYGAADQTSTVQALQENVIVPLLRAVDELQARWNTLDLEVRNQSSQFAPLTLSDIFPEAHHAIGEFRAALGAASREQGVAFYASLAEVYESGRRLGEALERVSAHTVERAFMAVAGKLSERLGELQHAPENVGKEVRRAVLSMAGEKLQKLSVGLAEVVLADERGVARFLPLPNEFALDTVNNQKDAIQQALGEELSNCAPDAAPEECAKRFARRLATLVKVADASSIAEHPALLAAVVVLFKAKQNLDAAREDVRALAAAGAKLLETFGPVPDALTVDGSTFERLVKRVLAALDQLVGTVANVTADNTMVKEFVPNPVAVIIPEGWTRPANPKNLGFLDAGSLLEGALYDFASDCQTASASSSLAGPAQKRAREELVAASNAAFMACRRVRAAAVALDSSIKVVRSTLEGGIAHFRPSSVEDAINQLTEMTNAIESALKGLLPDQVPALNALDDKTHARLGEAVGEALSRALVAQRLALSVANAWIPQWVSMEERTGGTAAKTLSQAVSTTLVRLNAAVAFAENEKRRWATWLENRKALRPSTELSNATDVTALLNVVATEAKGRLREWFGAALSVGAAAAERASAVARQLAVALADVYRMLLEIRNTIHGQLQKDFPQLALGLLVVPEKARIYDKVGFTSPPATLSPTDDQLHWDHKSLSTISTEAAGSFLDDADRRRYVSAFLREWQNGSDTPSRILKQSRELNLAEARARLLSIVDFSSLREEIDQHVKKLVPLSSELTYAFQCEIGPGAANATGNVFQPQQGCKLTVNSKTTVDLVKGTSRFESVGELGAFAIQILGGKPDAITIYFDGAKFESSGGPVRCDVRYRNVKIGETLKFLDQVQKFLTPKQGSGFYLVPLSGRVGIEAGYGLNLGTIAIGNVSFSNVFLNAAARLPFDNNEATFVASLARRDAPFTISVAPYGGSGFFALEASARGIVGFEASFEFGGAAAFDYGPLTGFGRLMTGVYIRRGQQNKIAVTFYAGGTASIWIFTFGASLYVTAESAEGRKEIVGNATFTYSFSIGLADYDYRVDVQKTIEWQPTQSSSSSSNAGLSSQSGSLHAGNRRDHRRYARSTADSMPELRADSWGQAEHWGRHRDYFDFELDIDAPEFK